MDDGGEILARLFGRFLRPEVTERIHADDGDAGCLQIRADLAVEIAPAAIARINHRHGIARGRRVENGQRQAERGFRGIGRRDQFVDRVGKGLVRIRVDVALVDVRMARQEVSDMGAGIGLGSGAEQNGRWIGEVARCEAVDHPVAIDLLFGRRAELFGERDAGFRVEGQRLADGGFWGLGKDGERERAAFAATSDDGREEVRITGLALQLVTKRLDIGDCVDAIAFVGRQRGHVFRRVDANDDRAVCLQAFGFLLVGILPTRRVRQQHDERLRISVGQECDRRGNHAGVERRVFGMGRGL